MSARSHVDVNERRLRPIYDCLDNGNNKKALQEADKVLKKQKDFQCAKVLKALALLRLGRHDDSSVLLQQVHAESPTDEPTLQAMAICYREVHKLDLIADMYENAHKARPDSEEILSALFMSYVRLGNYKKQQQIAMALHRLRPQKNPYYFWAVMSIVMQAHDADEKLAQTMYLPLAERMTEKYVKENKIEAEAEVMMYLIILDLLGKYEEELEIVQGELGGKVGSEPNFQEVKTAELLVKLKRWPQVNASYRKLAMNSLDNWAFYTEYMKSVFELVDMGWTPDKDNSVDGEVDYTVEKAIEFLNSQVEEAESSDHLPRGPYLARLYFIRKLRERKSELVDKIGSPYDLIKEFFTKFGSKFSSYSDVKLIIDLLDDDESHKFLSEQIAELDLGEKDGQRTYATDKRQLQRHLCLLQLKRFTGAHVQLTADQRMALIREYMDRYVKALHFGDDLLSTDLQYSDNYLLLVGHLLVDIWREEEDNKLLWQTIVLLEKGVRKSPSNYQLKILLIYLYSILGAFGPCAALYESMEIKHIQNDALGYVISNHVGRLGHFTMACSMYGVMLRFFTVNHKDTTEYLISSYKFGSFTKINEFVRFRERLQNSLQFATATAERLLLDLTLETDSHQNTEQMLMYMEIDPEKDKTAWEDLRDNRDFSVMTSWDPPDKEFSEENKKTSFKEEVEWLKIRNLTLRSMAAAVGVGQSRAGSHTNNSVGNGETSQVKMHQVLHSLTEELREHLHKCKIWTSPVQYPVCGPFRTRLSTYMAADLGKYLIQMLEVVTYIHTLTENSIDKRDDKMEERLKSSIAESVRELVKEHTEPLVAGDSHRKILEPDVIENVVLLTEMLAHLTILLGSCHRMLKPIKSNLTKKNKKRKENPLPMPLTLQNFTSLVNGIEEAAKTLHSAVYEIDMAFLSSKMAELKLFVDSPEVFTRDEEIEKEVTAKVRMSYQRSAKEILDFLGHKLHYLSQLKL